MSAAGDRMSLLGLGRLEPPEGLRAGARISGAAAYAELLRRAEQDPPAFWAEQARELPWRTPFAEAGGPGVWFAGGRLSPVQACLAGRAEEPVLTGWDGRAATTWSRAELGARVGALATVFQAWGLPPAARVLLALPRSTELLAAELACLWLGLTCVPLDPQLGDPGRVERRGQAAGCKAGVCEPAAAELLRGLPRRLVLEPGWERAPSAPPEPLALEPMHPAVLHHESSGQAFAVPAAGLLVSALSAYRHLLDGRGAGDAHWLQVPAHHSTFAAVALGALAGGGRLVLPRARSVQTPAELGAALAACRPRVLVIQVRSLQRYAPAEAAPGAAPEEAAPRLAGPRLLVIEGEAVSPGLYREVRERLFDGQTHVVQALCRPEAGGFLAGPCPAAQAVRPASVMQAAPGFQVAVVDERGQPCPVNYGGLLALRAVAPSVALELQRLAPPLPNGVRMRIDREGLLWTMGEVRVDRPEELQVATSELEAMIASLEGVDRVAVVRFQAPGQEDRTWAFVQSTRGPGLAELVSARLRERLGPEAEPVSVQVVQELPYTRSGKLLRSVLRRIAEGDTQGLERVEAAADPDVILRLLASVAPPEPGGKPGA
ncbi:MAG TPA: AMP-binding protein [Myxococcota bacterium]|nr:AMP-binding protein [Myxococcota bacterium]HRY92855.1 AMP-binding protein [Myxococcota bacterium]HSA21227.1 AMP-binding protein [Myxococcota bacterium]